MNVIALIRRGLRRSTALLMLGLLGLCANAHALSCPDGQQKDGALCYPKPRDGYSCTASLCSANCPDGYRSSGFGTCHYAASLTYTEKPYISRSHSGMQRCLALFYNDCRSGYRMDVCGICSYKGAWDTTRSTYNRGPGTNPDVTAAFRQVSITAQATYGRALHGAEGVYAQALNEFNSGLTDLIRSAAKTASKNFSDKNKAAIQNVGAKFTEAMKNPDFVNRMRRVVVAASKGIKDQTVINDMKALANQIGDTSLRTGWVFGVYGGFEAVAGAGVTSTVGVAIQMETLDTAPEVVGIVSGGMALGPDVSVGAELGLFFQQGSVNGKTWSWNGPVLGLGGQVEMGVGVAAGLSYQLATRWPVQDASIVDPNVFNKALEDYFKNGSWGFSLGVATGAGAGVDFQIGTEFSFALKSQ